jgi:hypothetical protein
VLVRVDDPAPQVFERGVGVAFDEEPDRAFAGEPRRQRGQRRQSHLRLVDAVLGDEVAARQRHPAGERRRPECRVQHRRRVREAGRHGSAQGGSDVPDAIQQRQRRQAGRCVGDEGRLGEPAPRGA